MLGLCAGRVRLDTEAGDRLVKDRGRQARLMTDLYA
jgi:hypothetical protein